jgi:16S rRNA processing protein RimM
VSLNPKSAAQPDWVLLAAIAAPHGVSGRVKVKSFTDPASAFADYKTITDAEGKPVKLRLTGQAGGMPVIEIEGVKDRNEAELWRGRQLGVTRDVLPALKDDKVFYAIDLAGMDVITENGAPFGAVKTAANYGAGDLLEITLASGGTEFFAFTDATFPVVDTKARRITIRPPHILGSQVEEEGQINLPLEGGGRSKASGGGATLQPHSKAAPPSQPSPLKGEGVSKRFAAHMQPYAKLLRRGMTPEERIIWQVLRDKQLGIKFRRQQPIGVYIADFVSFDRKIIIEIDGGQHLESAKDRVRDEFLMREGFTILRFWNHEIGENVEGIAAYIHARIHPHLTSPLKGEE